MKNKIKIGHMKNCSLEKLVDFMECQPLLGYLMPKSVFLRLVGGLGFMAYQPL